MIVAAARTGMVGAAGVIVARIEADVFAVGRKPVENAVLRCCGIAAEEKKKGPQKTWKSWAFHSDSSLRGMIATDNDDERQCPVRVPVLTGRQTTTPEDEPMVTGFISFHLVPTLDCFRFPR